MIKGVIGQVVCSYESKDDADVAYQSPYGAGEVGNWSKRFFAVTASIKPSAGQVSN